MAVAPWIVSDELWELVEPLLPMKERRFRYPGRKRLPDRQALQGICLCCTPESRGRTCRPTSTLALGRAAQLSLQ
jgi:transposase